ncbi:DNA primase, large subunit [Cordyceps fumosorosea ARSEF 2679]|uniref:DNA primase large subunit n=1 Tax=Cordyceps fumosorosea (strain ARSEF 2679) TaxID=1081104 RepID=A0A167NEA5_CORFA|nr:DNA primase, large subunit [Cordyceps fumosorosea ARSEF 2679]OAA55466.1 DNA primase, large subunit [Cordyceps fumosorosea ARSEF 2679]
MLRQDFNRIDPKRKSVVDPRRKQFATVQYKEADYTHRLNFYADAPTADITLEQFEQWAIDRLRVLAELEACSFRNKSPADTASYMKPILEKYLPLDSNSSSSTRRDAQRQKDHYSHFILRLAFASTEDLRRRFARVETMLFRIRFAADDLADRSAFVAGLDFDWWHPVSAEERREYAAELAAMAAAGARGKPGAAAAAAASAVEDEGWFSVDWERVPELVESRRVFVRAGKAFVPVREQSSMVVAEFTTRLEKQLALTARALPRLDEDDRLTPILNHLSKNFITPDAAYMSGTSGAPSGAVVSAASIDSLSQHFPACASHLHRSLRRDAHLKHYGRLQYSLFLKGIGLNLEEALAFWRGAFHKVTDDAFNKEYRYNVRHAYGDVGGDSNRRGGGYSPFSCQKILTEHPPGPGEAHGCPYRHFNMENLTALVQAMGVNDRAVLQGVKEDKDTQKYHMACNRVFEHLHKQEIKKAKEEGIMTSNQLETIVHPNEYFKRSYLLKNLGKETEDRMEG